MYFLTTTFFMKNFLILGLLIGAGILFMYASSQPSMQCAPVTETILSKVKNDDSFRYKSCEVSKGKDEIKYLGFFYAKNGFGAEVKSFFNCSDKKGTVSCFVH